MNFKLIALFLCLRFFSLLVVYLVGGIIFSKVYRQRSGKEIIPNYEFWTDVPSLVKVSKVCCLCMIIRN